MCKKIRTFTFEERIEKYGIHLSEEQKTQLLEALEAAGKREGQRFKQINGETGKGAKQMSESFKLYAKERDDLLKAHGIPIVGETVEDKMRKKQNN